MKIQEAISKAIKQRMERWKKGESIGFKVGRKHFTIIRDDGLIVLKHGK